MGIVERAELLKSGMVRQALTAASISGEIIANQGSGAAWGWIAGEYVERVVTARTAVEVADADAVTAQVVLDGVGAWTLSADGTDGASDITVSGADAACVWSVVFGGEVIASETDNSAPYAVTLAAPVAAGTYIIRAVATDGTKTGELEIEVV